MIYNNNNNILNVLNNLSNDLTTLILQTISIKRKKRVLNYNVTNLVLQTVFSCRTYRNSNFPE